MRMPIDRKGGDLNELTLALHNQLLCEKDRRGVAELSEVLFPLLVNRLKRSSLNERDPHDVETAVTDILIKYFKQPELFVPDKGDLIGYLYRGAYNNLLNLVSQEKKRKEVQPSLPQDAAKAVSGSDNPEINLLRKEAPLIREAYEQICDPSDREILILMMEGERRTSEYAEALHIRRLSLPEQAVIVKRHKDRIKIALRRWLRKQRLLGLIIGWLAALRERAEAIAKKNKVIAVGFVLVLLFIVTGGYFWQKYSATDMMSALGVGPSASEYNLIQSSSIPLGDRYSEKILFSSNRGAAPGTAQMHIWMMNPDGAEWEQVTFGDVHDARPELSRDGTKLVFSRIKSPIAPEGDEVKSIWVRDLITGTETPITSDSDYPSGPYDSFAPTWSPDGKRIAFIRSIVSSDYPQDRGSYFSRIWIVDYLPAIGIPKQLSPKSGLSRLWPSWSADGSHIFFNYQLWRDGPQAIYKINVATGLEEQVIPIAPAELSPIPAGEYYPKKSPDGSKIAWMTFRHGINSGDIYIADVADPVNSQYRVTPYSGWSAAFWSPDGKRLVLTLQRYKLTEKSIEGLREIGFTDEFLARLKNVNNKEYVTEKVFLDGLKSAIGEELTVRYSYKILQNANRNNTLWVAYADGSSFTQLTSGPWLDLDCWWGRLYQPDIDN